MKPGEKSDDELMYESYMREYHFPQWITWLFEQNTNQYFPKWW